MSVIRRIRKLLVKWKVFRLMLNIFNRVLLLMVIIVVLIDKLMSRVKVVLCLNFGLWLVVSDRNIGRLVIGFMMVNRVVNSLRNSI